MCYYTSSPRGATPSCVFSFAMCLENIFATVARSDLLATLPRVPRANVVARLLYNRTSSFVWTDAEALPHRVLQAEGGEEGDPRRVKCKARSARAASGGASARGGGRWPCWADSWSNRPQSPWKKALTRVRNTALGTRGALCGRCNNVRGRNGHSFHARSASKQLVGGAVLVRLR